MIKPVHVDENTVDFRSDGQYIITSRPASKLYYVYHNRNAMYGGVLNATEDGAKGNRQYVIRAPATLEEYARQGAVYNAPTAQLEEHEEDFPEFDYTPFDQELWEYFSYRFAAKLVTRLRLDDAAGTKAQSMLALAEKIGNEAISQERASEANINQTPLTWSEKLGLRSGYGDPIGGWSDRRR